MVCSPWTVNLLRVTNVKSLRTKWNVPAILHLAKYLKNGSNHTILASALLRLEESRTGRTKQNKTKPFITHSRLWLSWVSLNEKKRGKRWRTQLLELYSFKWEAAAHTWRITSQKVIFNIKILRPVGLNRMFYVNIHVLCLWDRGGKQLDFLLEEV